LAVIELTRLAKPARLRLAIPGLTKEHTIPTLAKEHTKLMGHTKPKELIKLEHIRLVR